jgi:hypothetical protein
MKLQNDGDVGTIFSISSQYSTKGPIKLDATLVRSVQGDEEDKVVNLSEAYMVEPGDEEDKVVNLSDS